MNAELWEVQMPKDNPLLEKVKKLREQLAEAEQAYKDDVERRQAELAEELAEAGFEAKKRGRKSGGQRVCGNCGELGHNARSCTAPKNPKPKKAKKKAEAAA